MPANTAPIYSTPPTATPAVSITAANTSNTGGGTIGTDIFKLYTFGSNGGWVSKVRFTLSASSAGTSTTATVGRVYLSTQTSGATTGGTNTFRLDEVAIPSQSADATTAQTYPAEITLNMVVPANAVLLVSTHHAPAANSQVQAIGFVGEY